MAELPQIVIPKGRSGAEKRLSAVAALRERGPHPTKTNQKEAQSGA